MYGEDDAAAYLRRLTPLLKWLMRAAHAIVGNRAQAEFALHDALLDAYVRRGEWRERVIFREEAMRAVRSRALATVKKARGEEYDWPGLRQDARVPDAVIELLASEPDDVQRAMALRYGCSLTAREAAGAMGMRVDRVREKLKGCRLRVARALRKQKRSYRSLDGVLAYSIRRNMNREGDDVNVGFILRSFERDAQSVKPPRHIARKVACALFGAVGACVCGVLFWLIAILMRAP